MMNRDVLGRQMFAKGGVARQRITDTYILETIQNLQNAMREGNAAVAAYVQENLRDLQDIAAVYPQVAPIINKGIDVLRSQTAPSLRQPMAPQMGKSLGDLMTPAPDGSMDYYAPGPFGYENGPEAPVMPEGPSEEDLRRYQENERGDQFLIPKPMPEMPSMGGGAPIEGVPMQMGGDPRAAAMAAMGAAPAAMPAAPAAMPPMGAPMPTDQGPVMDEGIASQLPPEVMQILGAAARSFGDPEKAESFEEMMNMIRGVPASEEERRMELAGVVGEQDAQQTPESVLTLVQPVMLLMGAEEGGGAPVDQGIGSVAQEAMNVPVEGPMAEGIMSMAGEGASPPANFNRGGEVRRYEDGDVVLPNFKGPSVGLPETSPPLQDAVSAPEMSKFAGVYTPKRTLEEAYQQRLPLLQQITGGGRDAAQIQFFSDLAKAGAAFAQPGKPGQSILSQLSASIVDSGIAENAAKLAATRDATERALKLKAFEGAEKELEAEETARRTSELARNAMFNQGVMAFTDRQQKVVDMKNAFEQNKALNQQKAAFDQLQAQYAAGLGFMSQAQLLNIKDKLDTARQKLSQDFEKNKLEMAHQLRIDEMGLAQTYKLEELDTSTAAQITLQNERIRSAELIAANKLEQDKLIEAAKRADARTKLAIEERLAKVKEDELSIKKHAAQLKVISDKAEQYKNPEAYVPALLEQDFLYKKQVPAVSDLDEPSETTEKAPFYKLWATGQIPATNEKARQISTMLENTTGSKVVYGGPEQGFVQLPEERLSPALNRAIVARASLPNSDISERVKTKAELQLLAGDKDSLQKKLETMRSGASSMFDGMAQIYKEDPKTTVSKAAFDLEKAMGASGLVSRAISAAKRFAGVDTASAADRGAYVARRIYVDGLQAALSALPGKENVKIQELLASVITGDGLAADSPSAFYRKSVTYLGSLRAGISRLEAASKVPTISAKDLQANLTALNELYATDKGVSDLLKALDIQFNASVGK